VPRRDPLWAEFEAQLDPDERVRARALAANLTWTLTDTLNRIAAGGLIVASALSRATLRRVAQCNDASRAERLDIVPLRFLGQSG
jgi:hypothetical protein